MADPKNGGPAHVAIISANAFDRGLDNDLGLPPDDFIVKPVRHSELLDWLERKLDLVWLDATVNDAAAINGDRGAWVPGRSAQVKEETAQRAGDTEQSALAPTLPAVTHQAPPHHELIALQTLVQLGFYRGIVNKLDALALSFPQCTDFVDQQRNLARQYQFETMQTQLQSVLNESPTH
jgi:hypothetical protein